jgi:hypothetical protein
VAVGAALALCLVASTASAKDLCIEDNLGEQLHFKKVKKLKPGSVVPVAGIFRGPSGGGPIAVAPADGVAMMDSEGTVKIGIFVHAIVAGTNNLSFEWTGDATFAGSGSYDNDGDNFADGAVTFVGIDCDSIPPP